MVDREFGEVDVTSEEEAVVDVGPVDEAGREVVVDRGCDDVCEDVEVTSEEVREDGMTEERPPVDDVTAEVVDEGSADVSADEEDMEELAGDEVSTVEEAEVDESVSKEESGVEETARDEKESKAEVDCVAESDEVGRTKEEEGISEVEVDRRDKDEEVGSVEEGELD